MHLKAARHVPRGNADMSSYDEINSPVSPFYRFRARIAATLGRFPKTTCIRCHDRFIRFQNGRMMIFIQDLYIILI